jgi:hypothetical protein
MLALSGDCSCLRLDAGNERYLRFELASETRRGAGGGRGRAELKWAEGPYGAAGRWALGSVGRRD